jgi:hypothetical protein
MTDKVITLRPVPKTEKTKIPPLALCEDFNLMLANFKEVMVELDAQGFAAVAVNSDGQVITTWISSVPYVQMLGAIEMLKIDFGSRQTVEEERDEW